MLHVYFQNLTSYMKHTEARKGLEFDPREVRNSKFFPRTEIKRNGEAEPYSLVSVPIYLD